MSNFCLSLYYYIWREQSDTKNVDTESEAQKRKITTLYYFEWETNLAKSNLRGYKRERAVAKTLGLRPVPFSGSRFELGREDAENDSILAQIKSSSQRMTIRTTDMWLLYCRATRIGKLPVIIFDGLGSENYPEQTWIAFPLDHLEKFYELKPQFKPETDGEKDDR